MDQKLHFDILIPGNYFCDIIFTGMPKFPALGQEIYTQDVAVVPGGTLNCVVALQRLGVKVAMADAVGNDFFSHFALHYMREEGLDTSLIQVLDNPQRRVTVALSFPQDRAFVTCIDPGPETVDMLAYALERADCRHVYIPGLVLEERLPALIRTIKSRGIGVSLDCQHIKETLEDALVRATIAEVDLFMPNRDEALRLTGTETITEAMSRLSQIVPHVVIKKGADGAIGPFAGEDYDVPGLVLDAVDTTGAGDVFAAGFLAAQLQGHHPRECMRWGNYCGGMSTLALGGVTSAPTLAQLQAWLAQQ